MDEKIIMQKEAFAVKACHMMGKSVEEASRLLAMDSNQVEIMYSLIDADMIDFNAGIDD